MEYRTIGYVAGTHGIKGEIRVKVTTDFIAERFADKATVYLEKEHHMIPYTVQSTRMHKGFLLVKFTEIHSINEVEDWKSCRLCISEEQLHELEEDEIYYHDLMHMQVETTEHEHLGEVVEILENGAQTIIRVKGEKELLIPYVKPFIQEVHIKEKMLIVKLIGGMK